MNQDMENIKEQIEEVIKKNLPEKEDTSQEKFIGYQLGYLEGFNQALSQINTSLIADEVLKVVVEKIEEIKTSKELKLKPLNDEYSQEYSYWRKGIKSDTREKLLKEYENGAKGNKMFSLQEKIEVLNDIINLLINSSTLEGEQSEHLSPNKENKNNG